VARSIPHILLWAIAEPRGIPESTRAELESAENDVLFSAGQHLGARDQDAGRGGFSYRVSLEEPCSQCGHSFSSCL